MDLRFISNEAAIPSKINFSEFFYRNVSGIRNTKISTGIMEKYPVYGPENDANVCVCVKHKIWEFSHAHNSSRTPKKRTHTKYTEGDASVSVLSRDTNFCGKNLNSSAVTHV